MVQRRAVAAGIGTEIGTRTFLATGITTYLKNGDTLENARGDGQSGVDAHHAAV
jgi:hypothetical protein